GASRKVTSLRPAGRTIGSSNSRAQPRLLMAPSPLVELGSKALWWPRFRLFVAQVAVRAGHARAATRASVFAFPRSIRVGFANPAAVLAQRAFHRSSFLPRITLTVDLAMP